MREYLSDLSQSELLKVIELVFDEYSVAGVKIPQLLRAQWIYSDSPITPARISLRVNEDFKETDSVCVFVGNNYLFPLPGHVIKQVMRNLSMEDLIGNV